LPSVDEIVTGFAAACMPVKPPSPGICPTCSAGMARRFRICINCHNIGRQLSAPLVPITPISLITEDSHLYSILRWYKSGRPSAALQSQRIAALLAVFLREHLHCLAPEGIDTVLIVPSLNGSRPPPHPLVDVLGMVTALPAALDCLRSGPGTADHCLAARDAVYSTQPLTGRRVLLVDDTYTSGAHLQSTAYAARESGAAEVHPLVVGRYLPGGWEISHEVLEWTKKHRWNPAHCIHCSPLDVDKDRSSKELAADTIRRARCLSPTPDPVRPPTPGRAASA
jgi:hypothetical protein